MARPLLLVVGWLLVVTGLYVTLVVLELYWNLYDWQPRYDGRAAVIILAIPAALVAMALLVRAGRDRVSRTGSLIACLALFGLGVYVFPAEPLSQGLFARQETSPFWYRAARFIVMILPGVFWSLPVLRSRRPRADNA